MVAAAEKCRPLTVTTETQYIKERNLEILKEFPHVLQVVKITICPSSQTHTHTYSHKYIVTRIWFQPVKPEEWGCYSLTPKDKEHMMQSQTSGLNPTRSQMLAAMLQYNTKEQQHNCLMKIQTDNARVITSSIHKVRKTVYQGKKKNNESM